MWPDSSRRAMHKHTAVSRFTAPRGQGNALNTAYSGREFWVAGGVKKGVLGLSMDFENLGVGKFNLASDTWAYCGLLLRAACFTGKFSPGGGAGLCVDFGNLVAHGRVGRSWPGIDLTPGFCLRPSPPVLLFSQGPQALPMLKRKAGRGALNTMDV